jgi:TRAP-type uncharacterized transport system fused permease subunit
VYSPTLLLINVTLSSMVQIIATSIIGMVGIGAAALGLALARAIGRQVKA